LKLYCSFQQAENCRLLRRFQRLRTVLIQSIFVKPKEIADNSNIEKMKHCFTLNISVIGEDRQGLNITGNTAAK
jgi:hypothetical protein